MTAAPLYSLDLLRLATMLSTDPLPVAPDRQAESRSLTCGSRVTASLNLDDAQRITDLRLGVHACALGQASAAIVEKAAVGESLATVKAWRAAFAAFLAGEADLPRDPRDLALLAAVRDYPGRHGAVLLPYDAVIAAFAAEPVSRPH